MWVDITSNSMIVYFLFDIRVQMVVVVVACYKENS